MSATPTPDEWEDMSESEREEFVANQKDKLDKAIEEDRRELDEQAKEAFDALSEGEEANYQTHTVELTGGQEVEVTDSLPGELERKAANARNADMDTGVKSMIDVMTHLIQTEGYDNPEVWRLYYEKYGSAKLLENVMEVTEPYYKRQKQLESRREKVGN